MGVSGVRMWRPAKASCNDAGFFKAEILASARFWGADDDVIDQIDLEDSGGFGNSPGEAHIGLTGAGIPTRP